jgi:hypothetical protein
MPAPLEEEDGNTGELYSFVWFCMNMFLLILGLWKLAELVYSARKRIRNTGANVVEVITVPTDPVAIISVPVNVLPVPVPVATISVYLPATGIAKPGKCLHLDPQCSGMHSPDELLIPVRFFEAVFDDGLGGAICWCKNCGVKERVNPAGGVIQTMWAALTSGNPTPAQMKLVATGQQRLILPKAKAQPQRTVANSAAEAELVSRPPHLRVTRVPEADWPPPNWTGG